MSGSSRARKNAIIRRALHREDPRCRQCHGLTVLPQHHRTNGANPDNIATIEHHFSRMNYKYATEIESIPSLPKRREVE